LNHLSPLILEGKIILVQFRTDHNTIQECFQFFQKFSYQCNDQETHPKYLLAFTEELVQKKIKKVLKMHKNRKCKKKQNEYIGML
jgi:hypothetical protein